METMVKSEFEGIDEIEPDDFSSFDSEPAESLDYPCFIAVPNHNTVSIYRDEDPVTLPKLTGHKINTFAICRLYQHRTYLFNSPAVFKYSLTFNNSSKITYNYSALMGSVYSLASFNLCGRNENMLDEAVPAGMIYYLIPEITDLIQVNKFRLIKKHLCIFK